MEAVFLRLRLHLEAQKPDCPLRIHGENLDAGWDRE